MIGSLGPFPCKAMCRPWLSSCTEVQVQPDSPLLQLPAGLAAVCPPPGKGPAALALEHKRECSVLLLVPVLHGLGWLLVPAHNL